MPDTRLYIESERIDDLPLALGQLHRMGVPQIVDAHLGSGHGNRQGLSYGQLTHGFSARIRARNRSSTRRSCSTLSDWPWSAAGKRS
jgi:hypothetical protein